MELEPPGDLVGGRGFEEIGAADLEATVSWRLGLPEEEGQILGASHGSWVSIRRVSPAPRLRAGSRLIPGVGKVLGGKKARNAGISPGRRRRGGVRNAAQRRRESIADLPNRHPTLEPKMG